MAADGAGTADLTAQLQASIDQAKKGSTAKVIADAKLKLAEAHKAGKHPSNRVPSCPICALPAQDRPKANANASNDAKPASTFKGRPVTKPEAVAARVKELGLKVRKDADVDALAVKLRATPDAVAAWLAARDGSKPTAKPTATTKATTAKAKPKPEAKAPAQLAVTLRHKWVDREPDYLRGHTLVVSYRVDPADGAVWMTITAIEGPDGAQLPHRGMLLPVDFRPQRQTMDNGRKVVLKDRTIAGLETWLAKEGLTSDS